MARDSYKDILDAIKMLASGMSSRTDGRITGVNLAHEAGISKAGLYRYLKAYPLLQEEYEAIRRNGIKVSMQPDLPSPSLQSNSDSESPLLDPNEKLPATYEDAIIELRALREDLKKLNKNSGVDPKAMANQILLLTSHNRKLQSDVDRLKKQFEEFMKVQPIRSTN